VFLAKPEVIQTLNAYYVPVANDDLKLPQRSKAWFNRLKPQMMAKYSFAFGPSAWIIAPDGKPLNCIDVKTLQHNSDEAMKVMTSVVADMKLKPGPTLARHVPDEFKSRKADDVALHVTTRFLLDSQMNTLDPRVAVSLQLPQIPPVPAPMIDVREMFNIRIRSPIDEWLMMGAQQAGQLLPPRGLAAGGTYNVPASAAAIIYRHLCPPTFNAHLAGAVLDSNLVGTVVQAGDETVVQLDGAYACEHRLWGASDANIAEGTVVGYLHFDSATRQITRLGLTTDPGVYGDRSGFRVPFVATAELWKGGYDPLNTAAVTEPADGPARRL
jgi:hypothetical protein